LRAARHVNRQDAPLALLALDHLCRWPPVRPLTLVGDLVRTGPAEAILADANAITAGLAGCRDQIEELLLRIDHNRANSMLAVILHLLRQEARVQLKM